MLRALALCLLLGASCRLPAPPAPPAPAAEVKDAAGAVDDTAPSPRGPALAPDAARPDLAPAVDAAPASPEEGRAQRRRRRDQEQEPVEKGRLKPNCSCCRYTGGAYISAEHQAARREQYRRCVERGGACSGGCSRPPAAAPRR